MTAAAEDQPAELQFKIRLSQRERECLDYIVFKYRAKSRTSAVKACIRIPDGKIHLRF